MHKYFEIFFGAKGTYANIYAVSTNDLKGLASTMLSPKPFAQQNKVGAK